MLPFRFAVHSSVAPTMAAWRDHARQAEELGYSALYVTDHFENQFGPLVAATVAAEATTSLHIGTLVLNNDLRNPVVLAKEIASLGLAAEGRVEVGLGAGYLRTDYVEAGLSYDDPGTRVERLSESLTILKSLWSEETTTYAGTHYNVVSASCNPRPASAPRLIVGGGSRRILSVAAEQADIVGVTTSMASGDKEGDPASRAIDHYDQCLNWVRDAAGDRFGSLELQIAAVAVMVVPSGAAQIARMLGYDGEGALDLPILLIGTEEELCERLIERRQRWGFSNVVVPAEALETFAPVVARLAGT
jgi:probable F420-dependent oxidoreductase